MRAAPPEQEQYNLCRRSVRSLEPPEGHAVPDLVVRQLYEVVIENFALQAYLGTGRQAVLHDRQGAGSGPRNRRVHRRSVDRQFAQSIAHAEIEALAAVVRRKVRNAEASAAA